MSVTAHPSTTVLGEYASGALALAPSLAVAAHLHHCEACRERVTKLEALAGEFLTAFEPEPLSPDALTVALHNLAAPSRDGAPRPIQATSFPGVPAAVSQTGVGARRWFGAGRWIAPIKAPRTDGWRAILLRAPAGARLPAHTHAGPEFTCVLTGAFREADRVYSAGDFVEASSDGLHRIEVTEDGPCLSLLACRGPLRGGLIMAALGRFMGI